MNSPKSSVELYDHAARIYQQFREERHNYLRGVEAVIEQWAGKRGRYLDVGAGDGVRSLKIAKMVEASETMLLDNSAEMLKQIESTGAVETHVGDIASFGTDRVFDLVTSLWNVFGHIPTEQRGPSLERIRDLLAPDGVFILDINNRYNVSHYGMRSVFKNVWQDMTGHSGRGNYTLNFDGVLSDVFIHNPWEMERAAKESGLKVVSKCYVHYQTGQPVRSCFRGQTVYCFRVN